MKWRSFHFVIPFYIFLAADKYQSSQLNKRTQLQSWYFDLGKLVYATQKKRNEKIKKKLCTQARDIANLTRYYRRMGSVAILTINISLRVSPLSLAIVLFATSFQSPRSMSQIKEERRERLGYCYPHIRLCVCILYLETTRARNVVVYACIY